MEIPLSLRERRDGVLVYALPAAFRAAMAAVVAVLAASLSIEGGSPGVGGWIALAIAAFGCLYEERWTFDPRSGLVAHRAGLVFLARRTAIAMGDIERFRLAPYVRGTLPGSTDEAAENEAALSGKRADDSGKRRARHKRPYLCLVCETRDGLPYLVNIANARKGAALKAQAARIAAACEAPLIE
jgi:hypothetical protein